MQYTTHAAHFFAAARAPWSAVDEHGQGGAVAGAFLGAVAVEHQNAAMFGYKMEALYA